MRETISPVVPQNKFSPSFAALPYAALGQMPLRSRSVHLKKLKICRIYSEWTLHKRELALLGVD